jgi:hypothetical protein
MSKELANQEKQPSLYNTFADEKVQSIWKQILKSRNKGFVEVKQLEQELTKTLKDKLNGMTSAKLELLIAEVHKKPGSIARGRVSELKTLPSVVSYLAGIEYETRYQSGSLPSKMQEEHENKLQSVITTSEGTRESLNNSFNNDIRDSLESLYNS